MLESIGLDNFFSKVGNIENNSFLENLKRNSSKKFYDERQKYTNIETLAKIKKSVIKIEKMIQRKFSDLMISI